ncbi:MAG: C4-type zinc ribbon domain-containing protein [Myxococcota bacterium]
MSFLAPLLEIQTLDLLADAERMRSAKLPERKTLPELSAKLAEIDGRLTHAQAERVQLEAEEEEIGLVVSQVVTDIEAAEVERYSGKRKNQDEAAAHKESQIQLHEKQASLEEQEMALLESIEAVDERIREEKSAGTANRTDAEKIEAVIRDVEREVSQELERLTKQRQGMMTGVPENILLAYDRVRNQAQKAGRGAAMLGDGRCGGCRIKLPSLERAKMLASPEDALIQCPQCRRVLVR